MLFGIIPLSLSALLMVCAIARRSAERRAEAAEQAAAEQAAAMKKAQAEAARRAAQDRAAAAEAARRAAAEQKKQAAAQKKQERERRAAEAHAQKVARETELAELAERRLQAEKELQALQQAAQHLQEQPDATPDDHSTQEPQPETPAQEPEPQRPAAQVLSLDQFAQTAAPAPQPFKGQTVAFTGKLTISGMTHAQAREKVKQAGGTAFEKEMPSFTTLLIVGENPGMKKLDKADAWIGNVRKMTEQQFLDMLASA